MQQLKFNGPSTRILSAKVSERLIRATKDAVALSVSVDPGTSSALTKPVLSYLRNGPVFITTDFKIQIPLVV